MRGKKSLYKFGLTVLILTLLFLTTMSVSAQDQADTFSDASVDSENASIEIPEISEDVIADLIKSNDYIMGNNPEYQEIVSEINSQDDLKRFVDSINIGGTDYTSRIVNLNADIEWDENANGKWIAIKEFNGTFNGNGHKISGINDSFLGKAGECSIIKDLKIYSDIVGAGITGGIADVNFGSLSNCSYGGTIVSDDEQHITKYSGCGGIAGINFGRIENCTTEKGTEIERDGLFCGGIAGVTTILGKYVTQESQPGVYGCINNAEINCIISDHKISGGATGGIVGLLQVKILNEDLIISMGAQVDNCTNYGEVSSACSATGGIVGYTEDAKIDNCTNYADITQIAELWTGGIVGSLNQERKYKTSTSKDLLYVNNCINNGNINGSTRVGGIVGGDEVYETRTDLQSVSNINQCINNGDLLTIGYAGGISGYSKSKINRCINTGNIDLDLSGQNYMQMGYNSIGGIAARSCETIENCISIGNLYVKTDEPLPFNGYSGGITGIADKGCTVDYCYNTGAVAGTHNSVTSENITVLYGGIAGNSGVTSRIKNIAFDNTKGMAERAIANYIGENSNYGLTLDQMTGEDALTNMEVFLQGEDFEIPENVIVGGTTYKLTPVIKGMPSLYEVAPERTLETAAVAIEEFSPELPDNNNGNDADTPSEDDLQTGDDSQKDDSLKTDDSSQTGDDRNFAGLIIILLVSGLIALMALVLRRK